MPASFATLKPFSLTTMRKQVSYLFGALAFAVTGACTKYSFPSPAAPREATEVTASFGRVWEAAIEELADFNAPISQLHRESGYLNTEMVRAANTEQDTLAECWRVKSMGVDTVVGPTNAYYNIVVRGDSSRARVKVNARWVRIYFADGSPGTTTCESRGIWERRTEAAIKARAEARR